MGDTYSGSIAFNWSLDGTPWNRIKASSFRVVYSTPLAVDRSAESLTISMLCTDGSEMVFSVREARAAKHCQISRRLFSFNANFRFQRHSCSASSRAQNVRSLTRQPSFQGKLTLILLCTYSRPTDCFLVFRHATHTYLPPT